MAAHMVDAQAPGLARRLRDLAGIPASGANWQERLLAQLGKIHLLGQAYRRIEFLSPETQSDVRTAMGWTQEQEELLASTGVQDEWLVLGQRIEEEEKLRVARTWLIGQNTSHPALLLQFAHVSQRLELQLVPGTRVRGELVFFPGAFPLRVLVKTRTAAQPLLDTPCGVTVADAFDAFAEAITHNPWLETFPLLLRHVIPLYDKEKWLLRDDANDCLPFASNGNSGWQIMALSGGRPLTVFGEWNGSTLFPLSVWAEERFVRL